MRGLFRRAGGAGNAGEHTLRASRGWAELLPVLKRQEGLRVLDFGATSPANINFLTALGHSVYMSTLVQDAARPEWRKPPAPDAKPQARPEFDLERFVEASFGFAGREFDVVLLWDTANYLPPEVGAPLFARLAEALRPGGHLLAFFHNKADGPDAPFSRYQLTDTEELEVVRSADAASYPIQAIYQTRQVERFLAGYSTFRFFLGKDNVREVTALR